MFPNPNDPTGNIDYLKNINGVNYAPGAYMGMATIDGGEAVAQP